MNEQMKTAFVGLPWVPMFFGDLRLL